MATPIYTPRINNNDDTVRLAAVLAAPGSAVRKGDPVIDLETDKATFTVEAEQDGYFLGVLAEQGATIAVGSILGWMGATADEAMPASVAENGPSGPKREASLKAMMLLARYGLNAASIPASGESLSAGDVERYIAANGLSAHGKPAVAAPAAQRVPQAAGRTVEMNASERGMLRTVEWHKAEACAAYLEIAYDTAEWDRYAAEFQQSAKLLLNPLLALLAWKLAQVAKARPRINATVVNQAKYEYEHVNLGFTVQAGERLYVVVVPEAETLSQAEFVSKLGEAQRAAMKNALEAHQVTGATVAFSSMARWAVTRHMPVLAPHTALMVAHTAPRNGDSSGNATLGATYDHRVLSGFDVVGVLQSLSHPERE